MIKGISPQGKYMYVHGGNASTYVNGYAGAQGVGNVRYNTSSQCFEVYDGNNWQPISMDYATVGLNIEAETLLDWAKSKMQEEQEMKRLAENHPAVAMALENLNKSQEQLKATIILSKDYEKSTS
jgi:hypothetical protein